MVLESLKRYFGYHEFRGPQKEVIEQLLEGRSSLVIMPTGMGKSLCYQLPSQLLEGMTLVISPLIALMKDQVDAANKKGLRAEFINSSLSSEQRRRAYGRLARKEIKLLYVTPERFRKTEFVDALLKNKVSLLAIDEAHCISQWGHDFRPDYTRIGEFQKTLSYPPTVALTATATPEVQKDIQTQLGIDEGAAFVYGVNRENLGLSVMEVVGLEEKVRNAMMKLHQFPGSAIIYFSLIDTLKKFSFELHKVGIDHIQYHGQLPEKIRRKNQEAFISDKAPLILATPAFGLGIDKANIRQVLHAEVPGSLEAYFQEIGRAGRDGLPAHCCLFYDQDDVSIQMDFLKWSSPDPGFIRSLYNILVDHKARVWSEGLDFLRQKMNFYNSRDFRVETALNLLQRWDCIDRPQHKPAEISPLEEPPSEYLDLKQYEAKVKRQNEKLLKMVQWARTEDCRMESILEYFGAPSGQACGKCDICIEVKE